MPLTRQQIAEEKSACLSTIAKGGTVCYLGNDKHQIGTKIVHVRFNSQSERTPARYKFNINPNTLSADYELWICGRSSAYYLIPIPIIQAIYDYPETYQDHRYSDIRIVTVDTSAHVVKFAPGGKMKDIRPFLNATLK